MVLLALLVSLALWAGEASAHRYFNCGTSESSINSDTTNTLFCDDFEDGDWAHSAQHLPSGSAGAAYEPNDGWFMTPYWFNDDGTTTEGTYGSGFNGERVAGYVAASQIFGNYAATSDTKPGCRLASAANTGATTVTCVDASTLPTTSNASPPELSCGLGWAIGTDKFDWTGKTGNQLTGVTGIGSDHDDTEHVGCEGSAMMGSHSFNGQIAVDELYVRYYIKIGSDYEGGHEKMTVLLESSNDDLSPVWMGFNNSGSGDFNGYVYRHPDGSLPSACDQVTTAWTCDNVANQPTFTQGHIYYIEQHWKLNTTGSYDGVYERWMNDCGTSVPGNCTGTPTKVSAHTDVGYRYNSSNWNGPDGQASTGDEDESGVQIEAFWIENWANKPSVGTLYYDNIVASKTGPIGYANISGSGGSGTLAMFLQSWGAIFTVFQALMVAGYFWERRSVAVNAAIKFWRYASECPTPKEMFWAYRYKRAVKRWQKQAPLMLPEPGQTIQVSEAPEMAGQSWQKRTDPGAQAWQ